MVRFIAVRVSPTSVRVHALQARCLCEAARAASIYPRNTRVFDMADEDPARLVFHVGSAYCEMLRDGRRQCPCPDHRNEGEKK